MNRVDYMNRVRDSSDSDSTVVVEVANKESDDVVVVVIDVDVVVVIVVVGGDVMFTTTFASTRTTITSHRYRTEFMTDVRMSGLGGHHRGRRAWW